MSSDQSRLEAQYRRIVDTATEGIWEVDAAHRTTFVNERLASMLGYSVAEMLGRPVYDFTDDEGRTLAQSSYERRRRGVREQQDFKLQRKDGSTFWVLMSTGPILSPSGEYLGAMAMVTDMSARREAEANLRQSEAWFRTLLEGVEDLIAVMAPDGTFRYTSPAFERVLGYCPGDLIGKRASSFAHPDETDAVRSSFAATLKEPNGRQLFHYRFRHADGSWRLLEGVGQNLIHDPVIAGVVVHGRDITERTMLEQQYRHAQKMEAVGRLVGGVAHDFNNLLAVILGESALLRDTLPLGHPGLQDLNEIRTAGERAADLTRQLLTFSRQQPMVPRLVDLNESVCHMENMLRRLLGEDIRLEVWPADAATYIRTDPGQLEQILLNLAINSRDAMPSGGRLAIGIERVELDQQYLQRHAVSCGVGPYARVTVTDSGCGMNEETRSRIFEPFFTTKPVGKGTGLGLSTVYGIVKQNEGFVWVYSEPGIGTSFKVYLPLTVPTAEDMTRVSEPETIPSGTETILVAEDDASVRSYVVRALERQGYTVLAGSDLDALALARASSRKIDLVVTDVVMPNLRGPDLVHQIRECQPDLKVLFMSGYPGHASTQLQLPDGVPCIQKPFAPGALGRLVRQTLDGEVERRAHPQLVGAS